MPEPCRAVVRVGENGPCALRRDHAGPHRDWQQVADDRGALLTLARELVRAGNSNTRAAKQIVKERLAAGFFADVRAAIAQADGK